MIPTIDPECVRQCSLEALQAIHHHEVIVGFIGGAIFGALVVGAFWGHWWSKKREEEARRGVDR